MEEPRRIQWDVRPIDDLSGYEGIIARRKETESMDLGELGEVKAM